MFSLADFCDRHRDRASVVGTDIQCRWNQSRKESRPVLAEDLDFRRDKSTPLPKALSQFNPIAHISNEKRENNKQQLLKILRTTTPRAVLLKSYPSIDSQNPNVRSTQTTGLPTIASMAQDYKVANAISVINNTDDFSSYCLSLLGDSSRAAIAAIPQGSHSWLEQRKHRLTASVMKNVVHFTKYHTANNYLTRKISSTDSIDCREMKHGRTWEPIARAKFVEEWQSQHVNASSRLTGLHISDQHPYIAASPDAILHCECHGMSVLEIKCTWKHWTSPLTKILEDTKYHFKPTGELKEASSWLWQVQTQLGVMNAKRAYLVLLYGEGNELFTQEISFSDSKWQEVVSKSREFFSKCLIPILWNVTLMLRRNMYITITHSQGSFWEWLILWQWVLLCNAFSHWPSPCSCIFFCCDYIYCISWSCD